MRPSILILALYFMVRAAASAATGKVIKAASQLLDLKGRHALSPSLLRSRRLLKAQLRDTKTNISGMRFAVQWKASGSANALKLRVEIRGISNGERPPTIVLEQPLKPGWWFNHWASLPLAGDDYKKIGEVTAWRATLWDGDQMIGEQKSFLW